MKKLLAKIVLVALVAAATSVFMDTKSQASHWDPVSCEACYNLGPEPDNCNAVPGRCDDLCVPSHPYADSECNDQCDGNDPVLTIKAECLYDPNLSGSGYYCKCEIYCGETSHPDSDCS